MVKMGQYVEMLTGSGFQCIWSKATPIQGSKGM